LPKNKEIITFLHYGSIETLGIDTSHIEIEDDVGGYGVPYFQYFYLGQVGTVSFYGCIGHLT
jgi:hypothetical protein